MQCDYATWRISDLLGNTSPHRTSYRFSSLTMVVPSGCDREHGFLETKNGSPNGASTDNEVTDTLPLTVEGEDRPEGASTGLRRDKSCLRSLPGANFFHRGRVGDEVMVEDLTIRRLRVVVFGALVVATVVITVVFYLYATAKERDAFDRKASENSLKVLEAVGTSLHTTMGSIDSFVSLAKATDQTWPFVTIPDFEVRSSKIRSLTRALYLTLSPIVTKEDRQKWRNYTATHHQWINESLRVQESDPSYSGPIVWDYVVDDSIHDVRRRLSSGRLAGGSFYVPGWQSSPVIPHLRDPVYNWDLLSMGDTADALKESIRNGRPVVSKPALVPGYEGTKEQAVNIDQWIELSESEATAANSTDQVAGQPASAILYPILAGASGAVIVSNNTPAGNSASRVVGFLSATIHWSEILNNVLAEGSNGTLVVFDNPCSPSFSFVVNGPQAVYLGIGDMHDKAYDAHKTEATLVDMASYSFRSYASTWIPLDTEYCQFSIRVYPSRAVEEYYVTLYPVLFTLIIFFVFVIELGCFYWYSKIVERRQRGVLAVARQHAQELQETNVRLEDAHRKVMQTSALQLRHFACMSHEIRTPLNAIVATASLLSGTTLSKAQEEAVTLIVASGELLRAIVDDVLDYAKLESGNVDIDVKEDSLQAILSFVVSAMEAKAGILPNRPSIRTFFDAALSEFVFTDTLRLRQILINLFSNALKFSKFEGVVEFMVSVCDSSLSQHGSCPTRPADSESAIGCEARGPQTLRFVVKDYGRGIKKDNFQRIFQPFLQESAERVGGVNEGTGLGLSITKKLVERLGGTIAVDSVLGEWSEFTVVLPCGPTIKHASSSLNVVNGSLDNVSILLVDDEDRFSGHMGQVFQHFEIRCHRFSSAQEMLETLTARTIQSDDSSRYICFSRLTLLDVAQYKQMLMLIPSVALITYGDHSECGSALKPILHLPSPAKLLPVVLIREMADAYSGSGSQPPPTPIALSPRTDFVDELDSTSSDNLSVKDLRVLVAEDNKINQKVLCRILERLGVERYEVVDDGQQAVEREAAAAFDVVLMDLQMPVMDGIEACRLIRARLDEGKAPLAHHPVARVVFVTASVSTEIREDCQGAGAVDFVAKPCNVSIIQACLERIVAMQSI